MNSRSSPSEARAAEAPRAGGAPPPPPRAVLVGAHPSVRALLEQVESLSRIESTVLILGESGTGKELVARAIHEQSPRAGEPFLGINCGAFSRGLLEDQLFGHVRGAFTGAVADQDGLFVAAGKGTLFLDEIAELDADLQGRLLRALEEREVIPLGSNRPLPWRARLLAATNRDLPALVEQGRFRRDLYYRINVVQVGVPPLRERPEDIPTLVEHFLERFAAGAGRRKRVSPEALDLLLAHPYPGNVRELRNAIERACALGVSDSIEPRDLPREFRREAPQAFPPLAQVEREHIQRALLLAGGRKGQAARLLRIDRNRLTRLLKKHRIERSAGQEGPPGGRGSAS